MTTDPVLRIVDATAGGDTSRVIVAGAPALQGATVAAKRDDFAARYDHLRWKLIQPPHGELHMCPVLLVDARDEGADFGIIIMESMGYPPISGSNLFGATAVALAHGFATMHEPESRLKVATPGGVVPVTAWCRDGRCTSVELGDIPARIQSVVTDPASGTAGHPVTVTVVSAGVEYAAVEAARLGVPLVPRSRDSLLAHGERLSTRAGTDFVLFHEDIVVRGDRADARIAVFQAPSVICRSPTGTGTAALLTLAHERGVMGPATTLMTRSPWDGRFSGRIVAIRDGAEDGLVHTAIRGDVCIGRTLCIP